nr:MAG TPA: hypothetical protein [Caudoviricetes sp.]
MREYGFTNYIDIGNTGQDVPMDSLSPEELKKVAYAMQEQVMAVAQRKYRAGCPNGFPQP